MSQQQQHGRKRFAEKRTRLRSAYLLGAAAILHLALTLLINLTGRFNLPPHLFDQNGLSAALALDSFYYRRKSIELVADLAQGRFADWLAAPFPFHVKLYSLSFAALSPLFGFSTLSIEPLNLFYYLSMVALAGKIGAEVFERRTALVAAAMVALWPSLLLHTTQLLRDPLFIVAMLVIVLVLTRWLTGSRSLRAGLLEALAAGVASAVVWVTRYNMWEVLIIFVLMGAVFLIVRQVRERRWLTGNLSGAALLLVMLGGIPTGLGAFLQPDSRLNDPEVVELSPGSPCPDEPSASAVPLAPQSSMWVRLTARADAEVARLGELRRKFSMFYANAGSNIDACVPLSSVSDLVRYLPRAFSHGFLAPYPNMWTSEGNSVGRAGRLLSGAEMVALYWIELVAVFGLWRGRRRLPVWLIAIIAIAGILALGFAVANAPILFRLRYVFMILVIILGAGGVVEALSILGAKRARLELL